MACLLGVVLMALAGWWFYRERKIDNTMAVVAQSSALPQHAALAQLPAPVPAMPLPAPPPAPAVEQPAPTQPALVMLNEAASAQAVAAEAPPVQAPKVAPNPESAAPAKRVARSKARRKAAALVAAHKPAQNNNLTETLKECRAVGYHATQCIERGCMITKFGLACRGG